jgi:glycosyltransferase involved in cell wall biosynthesis
MVSIVIPTRNSAATLSSTLQSIQGQTYTNIEVIVVDAYSSDSTREIAETSGAIVYTSLPERSAQVNYGAGFAKGKYVYRVDSDFILEPTVVEEAVGICEKGADAVLIHNTSDPTISIWSRARKLERDCYRDQNVHVAIRFMRRDYFVRVSGFLENLIAAEDYDLHNRLIELGVRVGRTKAQEVHIGEPRHLREVVQKHVYYGENIRAFIRSNPKAAWQEITPFRVAFLRHWRDFMVDPEVTLAFFVYEYVRYASALAGALADIASARPRPT